MEYIDAIVNKIIDNFDFAFMFIINVLSYIIVRFIYSIKKGKYVNTWSKRLVLMICTVAVGIIYYFAGYDKIIVLINSAILAPVFWDWILRPVLIKFGIDYKKFETYTDSVDEVIETKDTIVKVKSKDQ